MSLVRHAKSPYWYMSFMVNGKTVFRSTKTANKVLAQKIENETRKQMIEGIHFDTKEEITLKGIIDIHLSTRTGSKSFAQMQCYSYKLLGFKKNNITKEIVKVFGFEPSTLIHEMTGKDLFRLMMARKAEGIATSTFLHELVFFNGLIATAKQLGYRVPDIDIKKFKADHKIKQAKKAVRYLTPEEEGRLLAELDPNKPMHGFSPVETQSAETRRIRQDAYDFVIALLDTGARHEEIASLEWSRIDLKERTIRLYRGKVNNESTLYMTERLYEVLSRRSQNKDSEKYIFTNKKGGHRNYAICGFAAAARRAGIKDCTFHTMRKTLASKLVRGGLSISDVSVILGHASVATTQNYYASLSPAESSKRAVALLDK